MSKSFETQGRIHSIDATKEYGSNGFKKREFVIELNDASENPEYPNFVAFELIKDKCFIMDKYKVGDQIVVTFNVQGRLWKAEDKPERCFTSLQAWKISALGEANNNSVGDTSGHDDVPF
jgi:hypothetical protein